MSEILLSLNKYAFVLGLYLLILFMPHTVWPQAIPIELFQATLTIERMDNNTICEEGGISKSILLLGFDWPERIISLPKPSDFCLMASFDPNTTIADGRSLVHDHGDNEEWMVAFLPSQPLRGMWGIKITYPEYHSTGDIMLTWKPKGSKGFPPGRFFIKRGLSNVQGTKGINMKIASSAAMKDVTNNEIVKIEYYHDNCLFDTNIPSKEDNFEPEDDDPNWATMYYDQEQIHTLHDPNDADWIKFWVLPERKYYISLMPVCPPPIDPNIIPFELSLVINDSPFPLPPLELRSLNPPEYVTTLENKTKEGALVYLAIKINPEIVEYLEFLPYLFSLEETNLGSMTILQKLKISAKKLRYIRHIYLKSNDSHEECRPLPDIYYMNDPNLFFYKFNCNFATASNSFSLWLSDKVLDDNFDILLATIDLDDYLPSPPPDSFSPPPHDPDCDGIVGEEDPNPNRPNLLFQAGMNLYHHPFHPIYAGTPCEQIDLCSQFKPHLIDAKLQAAVFIKQAETPGDGWIYYPIDSNCADNIPLSNKAGCLLYLPDEDLPDEGLILENEKGMWGKCFSEMCDPNKPVFYPNDPNNLIIELAPGLNIIGLAYYEAFTFEENKGSEYRTFGDQRVDSFALLHSINTPTTSIESSVPSFDPNVSINNPKAQVYPEQNIRSSILRYDSRRGKWSYCTSFFGHSSGDRFDIGIDEAYLVYFNIQDSNNNQQDPNSERGKSWYPAIFFWP